MRINLTPFWRFLERLRLWPLSLAEKCRLAFGTAVIFILALSLLWPYIWIVRFTRTGLLDTNRAEAETLLMRLHFQLKDSDQAAPQALSSTGSVIDVNNPPIRWIRFEKDSDKVLQQL